jgi:hypothetical protein
MAFRPSKIVIVINKRTARVQQHPDDTKHINLTKEANMSIANDKLHSDFPQSPETNFSFRANLRQFLEYIKNTYPHEENTVNQLTDEFQQHFSGQPFDKLDLVDGINERITKTKALAACLLSASYKETELNNEMVIGMAWTIESFIEEIESLQEQIEKL